MKKKEKKMILILIIVSILIIGVIWLVTRPKKNEDEQIKQSTEEANEVVEEFVQVLGDGKKLNTSTKLNETKTVNGLEFSNIYLTEKDSSTDLIATVKNNTGRDITEITFVKVTLIDKEGKEIVKLDGAIAPIKAGGEKQFQINTTLDYANAYDFKVEIKK